MIGGAAAVGWRWARGKPTAPAEMLCFTIGVQQFAFFLSFVTHYDYNLLPPYHCGSNRDQQNWLLALPTQAGAVAALTIFVFYRPAPVWRWYFGALTAVLALLFFDSLHHDPYWLAEESLTLIGHPFVMALATLVLAGMPWWGSFPEGIKVGWHWCCLAAALVPFFWFLLWWELGVVQPRGLFILCRWD
jgi:hypothetical protein